MTQTSWSLVVEKLIVAELMNRFFAFYLTQQPTTGPYPEPGFS
jgi:hypothetical protein